MADKEPTLEEVLDGILAKTNMPPESKPMIKAFAMTFVQSMTQDQKDELTREVEGYINKSKKESEASAFD
ncbi:MAG: hypothetical protein MPJ22_00360 [Pirellulales bacterium]|nr:hypothetical protein [Pirellulales bacterium]